MVTQGDTGFYRTTMISRFVIGIVIENSMVFEAEIAYFANLLTLVAELAGVCALLVIYLKKNSDY